MAKNPTSENFVFKLFFCLLCLCVGLLAIGLLNLGKKVDLLEKNQSSANDTINNVTYSCDSGKKLQALYFDKTVELTLGNNKSFFLIQAMSGSGVRYTNSDESVTFWNKGTTAFLEEGNITTYQNCNQNSQQE